MFRSSSGPPDHAIHQCLRAPPEASLPVRVFSTQPATPGVTTNPSDLGTKFLVVMMQARPAEARNVSTAVVAWDEEDSYWAPEVVMAIILMIICGAFTIGCTVGCTCASKCRRVRPSSATQTDSEDELEINKYTVEHIRAELKALDGSAAGTKETLAARLKTLRHRSRVR